MKDGSMFSNLKKISGQRISENESGTAYLYLPEKTLQLEIVACERVSMRDKAYALGYNMTCDWPEEIILSTCSSSSDIRLILRCQNSGSSTSLKSILDNVESKLRNIIKNDYCKSR